MLGSSGNHFPVFSTSRSLHTFWLEHPAFRAHSMDGVAQCCMRAMLLWGTLLTVWNLSMTLQVEFLGYQVHHLRQSTSPQRSDSHEPWRSTHGVEAVGISCAFWKLQRRTHSVRVECPGHAGPSTHAVHAAYDTRVRNGGGRQRSHTDGVHGEHSGGYARPILERAVVASVESGRGGQQRSGGRVRVGAAEQGRAAGAEEQSSAVARAATVLVSELPREGDGGVGEELSAGGIDGGTVAERPRQGAVAVRKDREGHVHDGLQVSSVGVPSVRDLSEQLRYEVGV
jgi:hypothetical protein